MTLNWVLLTKTSDRTAGRIVDDEANICELVKVYGPEDFFFQIVLSRIFQFW